MSDVEDWREYYHARLVSPDKAAAHVKSGNRVVVGHAANAPQILIEAMCGRFAELRGVEVSHLLTLTTAPYCEYGMEESFRYSGGYLSANTRAAVAEGRGEFRPIFFSEFPSLLRSKEYPVDVALVSCTEPDENGFVSLGVSSDYTVQAVKSADVVLAAVKKQMPYVYGDCVIPVTDLDWLVRDDSPVPELAPGKIGPVEQAIGEHVAGMINDGDCLQLGIGTIPDAVLSALGNHRDLGIHSEMISDGVVTLAEKGVLSCARKTIDTGKIVIAFGMGSSAFYRWLDRNQAVLGKAVDYVNDPRVIGQIDNMVSINSALSIDLLGQVAADSLGVRQFSGVGGQVDFIRGAHFSKGGRSIIAMPSTAPQKAGKSSKISKICATFAPGQPVTTSRFDVDYVVTEHGVAALRWKSNPERMRALINIAAPEFREELARDARDIYGIKVAV